MKEGAIVELLRSVVRRSWGSDLKMCVIDPIKSTSSCFMASCLVHCYLKPDCDYSKSRLEKVMEKLNAFDYTIRVKSKSLLVTYYISYIVNLRKLIE